MKQAGFRMMDEHFDKIQASLEAGIAYSQKQIDTNSTTQTPEVYKSVPTPQIITEEKNTRFDRQERHIILGFTGMCLLEIAFKLIYIPG